MQYIHTVDKYTAVKVSEQCLHLPTLLNDTYGLVCYLHISLKYIKQVHALLKDIQYVMKAPKSEIGKVQTSIWIVVTSGSCELVALSSVLFYMFKVLHNLRSITLAAVERVSVGTTCSLDGNLATSMLRLYLHFTLLPLVLNCPEEVAHICKDTHAQVFSTALCLTVNGWQQSNSIQTTLKKLASSFQEYYATTHTHTHTCAHTPNKKRALYADIEQHPGQTVKFKKKNLQVGEQPQESDQENEAKAGGSLTVYLLSHLYFYHVNVLSPNSFLKRDTC